MKYPTYIKGYSVSLSATNKNFGIDKLLLFTDSFCIENTKNWNVVPNTKIAGQSEVEPTLLTSVNGEQIFGSKMYVNNPKYTAEIKHGYMRVQFNPSKFFHKSDLTTDSSQIADVLSTIQSNIKEVLHTEIDLFSTNISRLDIAAQSEMNNPVPFYDSIIKGSKDLKRAPKTEYPNGFIIGNGQRQIGTYDKGFKLLLDSNMKPKQPTNFLRVEPRFLNPKAVKSQTPFRSINDVLNADINKFKYAYSKTLNDLLKIDQTQLQFVELSALTGLIETAQTTYKRDWLNFLILVLSMQGSKLPTATEFEQALVPLVHNGTINRTTQWRNVTKYQKLIQQSKLLSSAYQTQSEINHVQTHNEFMDKFINPYKVA